MNKKAFIIAFSTLAVLIVALLIADRNIERTLRVDGDRVIYQLSPRGLPLLQVVR